MKKDVVVIGGGFAGSVIAKKLQYFFNVTLIDDKDYFEFTPSVLRTLVEPDKIEKIRSSHKKYLKNSNIILGTVKDIDKNFVYVDNFKIRFDYLAICSGSNYSLPIKAHNLVEATRSESLINSHKKLLNSNNILLIGGGLVGVELAAEICTHFPNKSITLISSSDNLIHRNNQKSIRYVENFLEKRNVKIIKGDRVISEKDGKYLTKNGDSYSPDLTYICTGIVPNYKFMENNFKDSLDEKNQIIVDEYLHVRGQKNIFCAGDVNNLRIEKTAQSAVNQAKTIIKNILLDSKNKSLKIHKPISKGLAISLGKKDGLLEYRGITVRGKFPAFVKFLIEKYEMSKYS